MTTWYEDDKLWEEIQARIFPAIQIEKAVEEVDKVINLLALTGTEKILDLCCGIGRHTIEFAKKGYEIKGVDRTKNYLEQAENRSKEENLSISFELGDMISFVEKDSFDIVLNLFTSFGYFENTDDDKKVLANIFNSLKKNGRLIIEVAGKEVLAKVFRERDWFEMEGTIFIEERKVVNNWKRIYNKWIIIKDGVMKTNTFEHNIYSAYEFELLLKEVGFSEITFYGDLAGSPYDNKATRLVVVAQKG